ncbi:MAG: acetyl-CoA carboxylase biotin carboxyl carrier protein [Hyphomicrobiaceae bacterium]|nr:acetyl-CoA carboxylase biotin carboxyl carrier protein [Hyphomicrobiaceae bacterium]
MELTYSDVENILKLVDGAEHLDEMEIVYNGFRLRVVRGAGPGLSVQGPVPAPPAPVPPPAAPAAAAGTTAAAIADGMTAVRAPMLGTFYRAPAPGEKPFVEVGQRVRADDTVCLIEVMKLFNSIRAGVDGTVVEILTGNGALVEHDQVLIVIAPAKED